MSSYEFLTVWDIDASILEVWDAIHDTGAWPTWWKGVVEVTELKAGDAEGVGALHRTVWKSALPYKLEFDSEVVRIEKPDLIEIRAIGELQGTGIWTLSEISGSRTRVEYDWRVDTTKKWMNAIAPVARPFFKWNHDVIMRWGQEGIKRLLEK
ncbi:MAG: SRPBCC family protein [Acidobacteria bacterium]|nr:SRPBCC family protein [Acidobacteriota bacterium]